MTITIENTNDESTIPTSSRVSIVPAAVEPWSPFQSGISMITEVTVVRTRIAAISLPRGTPCIARNSIQESAVNPGQPAELAPRSCQNAPGDPLPAPELVHARGQPSAGLTAALGIDGQPAAQALRELRNRRGTDLEGEERGEIGIDRV